MHDVTSLAQHIKKNCGIAALETILGEPLCNMRHTSSK